TGSRVLAPFIGTSTYVWTSLIGVILGALSLGYWIGGRMADRLPRKSVLASAILVASGLIALTTLIKDPVLTGIAAFPAGLEIKAVIAAILLFAPASVALGFVTPYAVKLRMDSLGEAGRTVGRLYALSTVGSIVGTFAAGFFLLPFLGSNRTLYLITVALFLITFLLIPLRVDRRVAAVLIVLTFAIAAIELTSYAMYRTIGFEDLDTEYSRVRIFRSTDPTTQRPIEAMTFDPHSTQSAMFTDSDELVFEYTRFYHLISVLKPDFRRSLMVGGAGYSFPKDYLATYKHSALDVVEIDPALTQIARRRFRLQDSERLRIFHEDARVFLNRADAKTYDVVMIDAFGSLFSVPYQLTTVEAVSQIHRILTGDGVVVLNLGSAIRGDGSLFLQAEFATYASVFPFVHLFKVRPERVDDELQNLIVVACKRECLPRLNPDQSIVSLLDRRYAAEFPLTVPVLTDDLAPVERYMSIAQANR
ncbi:MAG: fused MFS/spermidine synthase, partial [bacterium]|nr:fused MFS/spermidine synthase [bacterium]